MIPLTKYGFTNFFQSQITESDYIPARITAVHKERYEIVCEHGLTYGRLKTGVYYQDSAKEFPTTGDFVLIAYNNSGDSTIVRTLERKTFFSRRDPTPGRGEQAVAANFDFVFIIQSLNHDFNPKRLERYVTLALQSGATPVIVLTKSDLVEDFSQQVAEAKAIASGKTVVPVSAKSGYGLDVLTSLLRPEQTVALLGSSGVGKSSLVNALAGEDVMAVNEIREDDSRGKHTTTHRQLILLPSGIMAIDTPGMRELGMWDVSTGLGEAFEEVEEYLGRCRFSDCLHDTEPGCAVKAAIDSGQLSLERWESYNRLKKEAKYSDDKPAAIREKEQWHKEISKYIRQKTKGDKWQ